MQYGTAPPYPQHRYHYRGFRDYFHGLGREFPEETVPPPGIVRDPHWSVVFPRKVNEKEAFLSVAFSVPVWPGEEHDGEPVGILGLNLDVCGQTKVEGGRERFAVLVDTRPDASGKRGLVLRHPYLEKYKDAASAADMPVYYADEVVRWADTGKPEFPAEGGYADPAAAEGFDGAWLASAQRVGVRQDRDGVADTGWVILVQERRDDVMHPVRDLQWRLGYGAAGAVLFVAVLVLTMWGGMMYAQDASSRSRVSRLLRRWSGLPTPGSTIGVTGTVTSTPPGSVPSTGPTPRA